jgi:hypothetical protein
VQLGFKQSAHNNQEQVRKDYYNLAGGLEIHSLEQRETQREKKWIGGIPRKMHHDRIYRVSWSSGIKVSL